MTLLYIYLAIGAIVVVGVHIKLRAIPRHDNSTGYKVRYVVMLALIGAGWPGAILSYLLYRYTKRGRALIENWTMDGRISMEIR